MNKYLSAIMILLSLWALSSFIAMLLNTETEIINANVAIIPIHGVISVDSSGFYSETLSSETIIKNLQKAQKNPKIKAIILDINSPGGSPVATDEISQAIKSLNKTTVALIREVGASGAYWIASSCDYVIANRMSIVGSIGVIGSYLDFSGLMRRYNVTYQRFVAGEYKDMGSPYKEPSEEEKKLFQQIIDKMHYFFIEEVAKNRKMPIEEVKNLAQGQIFLGVEAKENGLIDALGTQSDAIKYIEKKLNITATTTILEEKKSLYELLSSMRNNVITNLEIGKFIYPFMSNFKIS